jgi:hypothetical protein
VNHSTKSIHYYQDNLICKRCGCLIRSTSSAEYGFCPSCLQDFERARDPWPTTWSSPEAEEDCIRDMNGALGRHNDDRTLIERDAYGNEVLEGPRFDVEAWLKGKN